MGARFELGIVMLISGACLLGCASATRIERNTAAAMKNYRDVYLIKIAKDPRNVMPRAIKEFESMGMKVRVVDANQSIEGAQGTGFVISGAGHVLTCAHVLGGEKSATYWVDGQRIEADVIATDKNLDLALLKPKTPPGTPLQPVSFRRAQNQSIGSDVFTIGYPLGSMLGSSIRFTKGSISATSGIKDDPNQFQVSAQVQPGNSGGPLFDKDGTVIGVIQQTLNPFKTAEQTGGSLPQNVNFAIKSAKALEFLEPHKDVHAELAYDRSATVEDLQKSVVRIRSGIITDEWERTPKLVAMVDYLSIWDIWYRFRYFIVRVADFDSLEPLFIAGQDRDVLTSSEEAVMRDTFAQVRKALETK